MFQHHMTLHSFLEYEAASKIVDRHAPPSLRGKGRGHFLLWRSMCSSLSSLGLSWLVGKQEEYNSGEPRRFLLRIDGRMTEVSQKRAYFGVKDILDFIVQELSFRLLCRFCHDAQLFRLNRCL